MNADNVGSKQMQQIRAALRGKAGKTFKSFYRLCHFHGKQCFLNVNAHKVAFDRMVFKKMPILAVFQLYHGIKVAFEICKTIHKTFFVVAV